ncbi:MAG: hypothetical protein M3O67_01425, partial [Bacteroidota bacterium]|nr:hypothetical protein [Bacteroidota bacterium]
VLTEFVKSKGGVLLSKVFIAEVFNKLFINIRLLGWVGCALAFLALCKVSFVSGFCVPCNVLKIALGRVAKSC